MELDFQAILDGIKNRPDDFHEDGFVLLDHTTQIEYWVVSGIFFYGVHRPCRVKFSLKQKVLFHVAYRDWRKKTKPRRDAYNQERISKVIKSLNKRLQNGL